MSKTEINPINLLSIFRKGNSICGLWLNSNFFGAMVFLYIYLFYLFIYLFVETQAWQTRATPKWGCSAGPVFGGSGSTTLHFVLGGWLQMTPCTFFQLHFHSPRFLWGGTSDPRKSYTNFIFLGSKCSGVQSTHVGYIIELLFANFYSRGNWKMPNPISKNDG